MKKQVLDNPNLDAEMRSQDYHVTVNQAHYTASIT
jgi:hypothetical protein